ncbi:MAG: hypothetical protein OEY89_14075 [Gammaproteobacteria bacterium]|nr:hypothetical protein [Gammaproteobacteria bacterium]
MSKKDKIIIGHDPLEWLKEENIPASSLHEDLSSGKQDTDIKQNVMEVAAQSTVEATSEPTTEVTLSETGNDVTDETNASYILDFKSSLQIMDAAQLKPQLQNIVETRSTITLRADPDITVDGAGIQLLLGFVNQAKINRIKLHWEVIPAPIIEAAKLLNTHQVVMLE